jgi:hypothetical protein
MRERTSCLKCLCAVIVEPFSPGNGRPPTRGLPERKHRSTMGSSGSRTGIPFTPAVPGSVGARSGGPAGAPPLKRLYPRPDVVASLQLANSGKFQTCRHVVSDQRHAVRQKDRKKRSRRSSGTSRYSSAGPGNWRQNSQRGKSRVQTGAGWPFASRHTRHRCGTKSDGGRSAAPGCCGRMPVRYCIANPGAPWTTTLLVMLSQRADCLNEKSTQVAGISLQPSCSGL